MLTEPGHAAPGQSREASGRAVAAVSGCVALLLAGLALVARPWRIHTVAAVALAAITLGLLARRTDRERRRRLQVLLLLSAQVAAFLISSAGSEPLARFRLLQVAALCGYAGTTLAVLLIDLRGLPPRRTLLPSASLAAGLLALETLLGFAGTAGPAPTRPEWVALRDSQPARPRDSLPARSWTLPVADSSPASRFLSGGTVQERLAESLADQSDGPRWTGGRARAHPQLGIVFAPHSELRTVYLDNPRGYFEQNDFRKHVWEMGVMPGSAATLEFPAQDPSLLRITITRANRDTLWHIQLEQAHLDLEARAPYALEFRARADRARSMRVGVGQAHSPFGSLGLNERVELTSEWRGFRQNFQATRTDSNSRIHFDLAGSDASVELAAVVLRSPHGGQPVEPELPAERYFISYRFNAQGCRGPDYPLPRAPRSSRILLLGNGFTLGVGVREQDTFARRLENVAERDELPGAVDSGKRREVVNCGVPEYGTREERRFYQLFGAQLQPDTVVLVMGLDDDRSYWEQRIEDTQRRPGRLARLSAAWRLLREQQVRRRSFDYAHCLDEIRALDREVRAHGARLVVAVLPTDSDGRWTELAKAIRSGLTGTEIATLIVDQPLSLDEELRNLTGAPDERGHQAAARELGRYLRGGRSASVHADSSASQ